MSLVYFTVPGDPRGKGSVRVGRGFAYKDAKTENYMATAILFARAAWGGRPAVTEPTSIQIVAVVRRPKSLIPKARARTPQPSAGEFYAPVKPDLDNLAKSLLDALVQAGVLVDDCRVVRLAMHKLYAAVGAAPEVRVSVARA